MNLQKSTEKAIEVFERDFMSDGELLVTAGIDNAVDIKDFIRKTRCEAVEEAFEATRVNIDNMYCSDELIVQGMKDVVDIIQQKQTNYLKEEK